jgi:hypothetical protein
MFAAAGMLLAAGESRFRDDFEEGMVADGPNSAPDPGDGSRPDGWPVPVWGYWGDPAFPRDGSTPLDGRYSDNDSWSTNEVAVDWQGAALYSLYFAQWAARRR